MNVYLQIKRAEHNRIQKHFSRNRPFEQVVFLFMDYHQETNDFVFKVDDLYFVSKKELAVQSGDYLELTDDARKKIIKMAWDKGKALGEIHSHPLTVKGVMFSYFDLQGFKDFVPHIWWRLNNKPYIALVSGVSSIDALAWITNPDSPQALREIRVDDNRCTKPTGKSLTFISQGVNIYE